MGTPEFAVEPLKKIAAAGHDIAAVITQPDKPVGRKALLTPPPLKVYALEKGYRVLQFNRIRDNCGELKSLNADIMITCAYGQILTKEILDICPHGVINIHASILPKYRGASPIEHAVINGEKETGVTIMQTEEGLDTGDIILTEKLEISDSETAGELTERLSILGAEAAVKVLELIEGGKAVKTKQDESLATKVKTIKTEDALIDFSLSAREINNFIRGMNPRPIAFTYLGDLRLKIYFSAVSSQKFEGVECGKVMLSDTKKGLFIGTGKGVLEVLTVQAAGGKILPAKEFLRGNRLLEGSFLGARIE